MELSFLIHDHDQLQKSLPFRDEKGQLQKRSKYLTKYYFHTAVTEINKILLFFCNLQNLQNERNPWFIKDFEQNRKAIPLRIWIWGTEKYTLHFRNPNAVSSSTERKSFILDDFGAKNTKRFVYASETFLNKTRFLTKFKGFWRVLIQADPNLINIPKSDQNVYFLKHLSTMLRDLFSAKNENLRVILWVSEILNLHTISPEIVQ